MTSWMGCGASAYRREGPRYGERNTMRVTRAPRRGQKCPPAETRTKGNFTKVANRPSMADNVQRMMDQREQVDGHQLTHRCTPHPNRLRLSTLRTDTTGFPSQGQGWLVRARTSTSAQSSGGRAIISAKSTLPLCPSGKPPNYHLHRYGQPRARSPTKSWMDGRVRIDDEHHAREKCPLV